MSQCYISNMPFATAVHFSHENFPSRQAHTKSRIRRQSHADNTSTHHNKSNKNKKVSSTPGTLIRPLPMLKALCSPAGSEISGSFDAAAAT